MVLEWNYEQLDDGTERWETVYRNHRIRNDRMDSDSNVRIQVFEINSEFPNRPPIRVEYASNEREAMNNGVRWVKRLLDGSPDAALDDAYEVTYAG